MGERLLADLRLAVRGYRLRAGLTLTIAGIMALAIGAVTATYSLLDWVILRPLPYPDARHIYSVGFPQDTLGDPRPRASLHDFELLQSFVHAFDRLAISRWNSVTLALPDEAEQLDGNFISPAFLSLFGAQLAAGRVFSPTEYSAAATPVALLSYDLWQRRFQRDPHVIGAAILLNSQPYTVIGVLSPRFHDPLEYRRHAPVDLWLPLIRSGSEDRGRLYYIQGHLSPDHQSDQVRAALHTLALSDKPQVMELQRSLTSGFQIQLMLLSGAVALLLPIACANVSGLLLARGAGLEAEMAVRLALGASRRRLVQQQLTETGLLSLFAGIVGLLSAGLLLSSISRFLPIDLPRAGEVRIDARIALFTLLASLLTAAACGLWPALRASGARLSESMRGAAPGVSGDRRWRNVGAALVILQIGLSFVLLAGATLLVKSFWRLVNVNAGFTADHVLTMQVRLPRAKYKQQEQRTAFYAEALRRLSSLPGVTSAAMVTTLPLAGSAYSEAFLVQDHPVASDAQRPQADWNLVSPSYFKTLHIALVEGRVPSDYDLKKSKDVVVINRYFARQYWPQRSAIGKYVRFGSVHDLKPWAQVIGVVDDVKHQSLDAAEEPQIYQLYPALPPPFGYFVMRAAGEPSILASAARKAIGLVDSGVPVEKIAGMAAVMSDSIAVPRFRTGLLMAFGCVATILAALGIYGAIAYSVTRRKREIGIRMALGASPLSIGGSVLATAGKLLAGGLLLGSAGAIAFNVALRSLLFSVQPLDASALLGSLGLLLAVGFLAALIPAERAAGIDPVAALREN